MVIDEALVKKIFRLVRLELEPDEIAEYQEEMSKVLSYFSKMDDVEINETVEEDAVWSLLSTHERDDTVVNTSPEQVESLLRLGASIQGRSFKVPKIID